MKISIICSTEDHPIDRWLQRWVEENRTAHEIELVRQQQALNGGDLLFIISCTEIISRLTRDGYEHCLVIHASDLPKGRGWSPYIWNILAGETRLVVTLLEAEDAVDSGAVWKKLVLDIPKHALIDDINAELFSAELKLMSFAVDNAATVVPVPQSTDDATYLPRRTPADSEVDPNVPIAAQFDLIRVCDPDRYPAFFTLHGHRYAIRLEKIDDE